VVESIATTIGTSVAAAVDQQGASTADIARSHEASAWRSPLVTPHGAPGPSQVSAVAHPARFLGGPGWRTTDCCWRCGRHACVARRGLPRRIFLAEPHCQAVTQRRCAGSPEASMDAMTKDWLIMGCSVASLCASLSVPILVYCASTLHRGPDPVRIARQEAYAALLGLAARASDRFQSAAIRHKLQRVRPDSVDIAVHVDEDLAAGWIALGELGQRLEADQLLCSDKVIRLISEAKSKHFWNAESLFRLYGHAALDLDELHKHAQALVATLRQRCRRDIGLTRSD
jgi:hypothetical protein